MIDTAGTLEAAARTVLDEGATRVYAAATHARLLGQRVREPRASRASRRSSSPTRFPSRPDRPENVRVLPCAELLTDSIRRIFVDDSVSEVFGGENQLF